MQTKRTYQGQDYFPLSEFMIDEGMRKPESKIPLHVAQKIERYHKPILNPIRFHVGEAVRISQHSGYRSYEWERSKGRKGDSQHCYGDRLPEKEIWKHWGANDLTTSAKKFDLLLKLLIQSAYTRVALYEKENFIHVDFKGHEIGDHARGFWVVEYIEVEKEDGTTTMQRKWVKDESVGR